MKALQNLAARPNNELRGIFFNYLGYVEKGKTQYKKTLDILFEEMLKRGGCGLTSLDIQRFNNAGKGQAKVQRKKEQESKDAKNLDQKVVDKFLQIKKSAKHRSKEFDLSLDKIRKLLTTKRCYYTGVRLNEINGHPNSRTFERLDQNVGYIDSNVVACSYRANILKEAMFESERKFTKKQLQMMVKKLRG